MDSIRRVTPEEKKDYFEKALKDAVELGIRPERTQMIETETLDVIFTICDQHPNPDPKLVKKARDVFAVYFAWLTS